MLDLCMNCMERLKNDEEVCPKCHEMRNQEQPRPFLAKGKIIGERYIVGKGIKKDPEGLSYVGYDFIKNSKVYVRELFPQEICTRGSKNELVVDDSAEAKEKMNILLKDFLGYFRSIARLRNLTSIVSVYDILEQNGTAYVIMQWIDGKPLDEYLQSQGESLSWKQARTLFMPVLSSLIKMHFAGVKHLGIAPCNMIVTDENKIKLTGFATSHLRTSDMVEERELFDGCSALEQYIPDSEISENTDVYGFAACLFFALTGEYPLEAMERKKKDRLLMPSDVMKQLPDTVVSAIANALRVYPNSRTISFEALRIELSNSPVLQVKNIYDNPQNFDIPSRKEKPSGKSTGVLGILSCVFSLIILAASFAVYWFWIKNKDFTPQIQIPQETQTIIPDQDKEEQEDAKVEVPQLVGKALSDVEAAANISNDYKVVVLSEEFHESIPEGKIISQSPAYGEKMYSGSTITVNVSKGKSKRALPDITGKSLSEASLLLADAKFITSQVSEENDKFKEGTVIGYQSYKAGDLVDYGSDIVIVVSKG